MHSTGPKIVCAYLSRRALVVGLICLFASSAAAGQKSPEKPTPELKLRDIRGRTIRLSDYRGKVVLINFWATWCPPCGAEIPDLVQLQRDYRHQGLRVIGITYPPQQLSAVREFTQRLGVNYPIALGTKETKALFTSSEALPITIVLGKDGRVRDIIEGILLPQEFEQMIKPLLSTPASLFKTKNGLKQEN